MALTMVEEFTVREAAAALGLSESAAKMWLSRLRGRLRSALSQNDAQPTPAPVPASGSEPPDVSEESTWSSLQNAPTRSAPDGRAVLGYVRASDMLAFSPDRPRPPVQPRASRPLVEGTGREVPGRLGHPGLRVRRRHADRHPARRVKHPTAASWSRLGFLRQVP